ncbi:MAG: hypothetical protein P4L43_11665 [Syntrophobacteraceae bacterium]|nr:hypothetical protein [Syntrophobacteraceae bacterium]
MSRGLADKGLPGHAAAVTRLHRDSQPLGIDRARERIVSETLQPPGIAKGVG